MRGGLRQTEKPPTPVWGTQDPQIPLSPPKHSLAVYKCSSPLPLVHGQRSSHSFTRAHTPFEASDCVSSAARSRFTVSAPVAPAVLCLEVRHRPWNSTCHRLSFLRVPRAVLASGHARLPVAPEALQAPSLPCFTAVETEAPRGYALTCGVAGGRQKNGHQRRPNPQTRRQRALNTADGMTVASQLTLKKGDDPGLPGSLGPRPRGGADSPQRLQPGLQSPVRGHSRVSGDTLRRHFSSCWRLPAFLRSGSQRWLAQPVALTLPSWSLLHI